MSEEQPEKWGWAALDNEQRDHLMDLASTIILSIAVVLTAFSAWQSTLWSGEQSKAYARASSLRGQSNAALTTATTEISYDATSFALGITEFFAGDEEAVEFFRERLFRDEFKPAVEAWIATEPLTNPDAPQTPFDVPEFSNASLEEADELSLRAESELNEGNTANKHGDNYILATVMFAATLFFTGIVTKFENDGMRFASLSLASVALVVATVYMLALPKLFQI